MKQTLFWLLAFTLIVTSCAAPASIPTDTPALSPATATEDSPQPEPSTATPSPEPTATATPKPITYPQLGSSFQLQFTGEPINTSIDATIYDLDLFDTDPTVVASLQSQGKMVFCF